MTTASTLTTGDGAPPAAANPADGDSTAAAQAAGPVAREPGLLGPALSLARRELVRFLRQRHRVIGALATPVVFWLLIGGGMGRSISFDGSSAGAAASGAAYAHFFFPGTLVMILLFTAIFSTISVIEDRREGFLQGVLIAPVSRHSIALGKLLGGTVLATGQGLLFLLLAPLVGFRMGPLALLGLVGVMLLLSLALTALGFCIAWRMTSTQGFHAIMNLFLLPMWFLSGALFPAEGAMWGLKWVMLANPLTYGLAAVRGLMNPGEVSWPPMAVSLAVTVAFAAVLAFAAGLVARRDVEADQP